MSGPNKNPLEGMDSGKISIALKELMNNPAAMEGLQRRIAGALTGSGGSSTSASSSAPKSEQETKEDLRRKLREKIHQKSMGRAPKDVRMKEQMKQIKDAVPMARESGINTQNLGEILSQVGGVSKEQKKALQKEMGKFLDKEDK
jgi:hypothetical protein